MTAARTWMPTEARGRDVARSKLRVAVTLEGIPVVGRLPITPDRLGTRTPTKARKIPIARYVLLREMLLLAIILPWSLLNSAFQPSLLSWPRADRSCPRR